MTSATNATAWRTWPRLHLCPELLVRHRPWSYQKIKWTSTRSAIRTNVISRLAFTLFLRTATFGKTPPAASNQLRPHPSQAIFSLFSLLLFPRSELSGLDHSSTFPVRGAGYWLGLTQGNNALVFTQPRRCAFLDCEPTGLTPQDTAVMRSWMAARYRIVLHPP